MCDGGWAELTGEDAAAFAREAARYDVTTGFLSSGIALVRPTLLAHGTDAQRERYLGPLLRGDEVWCQLFSEPSAGSDLASLRTAAVRDGDEFVVDGQKVWTSGARHADLAILLARTNPAAPKHRGITYFVVDMRTPGIDVRPLRQINGTSHFNEVFLTGVRVPAANVVGAVDEGWTVARTTLANESAHIGGARSRATVDTVIELARARGLAGDPVVRQRLAQAWARERVLAWTGERRPRVDGSVLKVLWSQSRTARDDLAVDLLGAAGTGTGFWQTQMLNRFWGSIGGGTDEVHRNMIGERALGLPREPKTDAT